jgi:hypothetical protein
MPLKQKNINLVNEPFGPNNGEYYIGRVTVGSLGSNYYYSNFIHEIYLWNIMDVISSFEKTL